MWDVVLAQATEGTESAPATSPSSGLTSFVPMIAIFFLIMYLFMIRPNQKRDRERRQMLAALAKGDKVVTTGGICGTVVGLSERSVVVRVDDNVNIEFLRGAISQITSSEKEE
ncbi:MAG: preprotein translocase subunit YajC [Candidatus Hydrogenedentes bacterium]|nr:preprotein translocase subunit YajC [Candidatus Hydrogenedentota bacterium]